MPNDCLLILDGSSLLSTQFFGNLPREILFAKTAEEKEKYFHKIMMTRTGVYTNAVYGFLRVLFRILKEYMPTHLAVTWDLSRDTFRREIYPAYKGTRGEVLRPLSEQFRLCQDVLRRMGVREFMDERFEADDFSGTLARKFEGEIPVKILTKDHDYLQLVTGRTHLWLMMTSEDKAEEFRKKYGLQPAWAPEKTVELDPALVEKEFLVKPASVAALKGLQGDSSDNIPGVPGIGPKTAAALIAHYETLDALYDALRDLTPEKENALKAEWKALGVTRSPIAPLTKTSETELVGEASARLSEKLATIDCELDLGDLKLEDLQTKIDLAETAKILRELEISSLSMDFAEGPKKGTELASFEESDDLNRFFETVEKWKKEKHIGLSYEPGLGLALANPAGQGLFFREAVFLNADTFGRGLQALQSAGASFAFFGGKGFWKTFRVTGDDVSVMAYLLDPNAGHYEPETLLKNVLEETAALRTDGAALALLSLQTLRLYERLEKGLREKALTLLYETIERPTTRILADLEDTGILVNREEMKRFSESLLEKMETLEKEIYELAGQQFNIQSPKQLGQVLFEDLKLPYGKKTKSGYSTSADILEHLKEDYPVVRAVLEYRTYAKLRSTYAEALPAAVSSDGRIHGKFHQTATATGRISSSDPNLQNIPVRTELGRGIRKMFVPKPGTVFIDADYSQIELRILAHLSGDEELIRAYNESRDIHALTASQVFKVPLEEVTAEERRRAKAVNFGIVYGISAFSLSEDLSISYEEAVSYRNAYFETYPGVKRYLDETVSSAYEKGCSTTLFGRIREIPELRSGNFNQRSFGERVAMNAPIQGTAADIMKLAVIRVDEALRRENLRSRMVLQVHDEILIEAYEEEADAVEALLVREMENAAKLKVRLKVEAKRGYSWYETK